MSAQHINITMGTRRTGEAGISASLLYETGNGSRL
jgi:hypothetical protein